MSDWPCVELDPVERLRVLARALPHVCLVEGVLDAPFDRVWSVASDLEGQVPHFETTVRSARILRRDGPRLVLETRGWGGRRLLDVRLEAGFCLMRSAGVDIGMAARPAAGGAQTRFAHFEGLRRFGRLLHPYLRRALPRELGRIEALARSLPV